MGQRKSFTIGGLQFGSQKALREYCRALLYARTIEPEGQKFLLDLLQRHPEAEEKIGVGVSEFYVDGNEWGNRCFHVKRIDGSRSDFSFESCIKPPTPAQDAVKGFREAVKDQIFAFKDRSFAATAMVPCAITGSPVHEANAHVDHRPPETFLALVNRFVTQEGIALADVRVNDTVDLSTVTQLADAALAARWQAFHAANAVLQITSARANLSQGGRLR